MHEVMQPRSDPGWVLTHEGYNVLTENAVEFPFCARQRISGHAGLAPGQSRPDLG